MQGRALSGLASFVDAVRAHAGARPQAAAFTFLAADGEPTGSLTYAQVDRRARAFAADLQASGDVHGERLLILQPEAIDFITAFLGGLYAGAVAMPLAPFRSARQLAVLNAILHDGAPGFMSAAEGFRERLSATPGSKAKFLRDRPEEDLADHWQAPRLDGSSLALLQYTSGSTGVPRGVMVSHGNLLHNVRLMSDAFRTSAETVFVSWLPLFHDMGLIGNVLHALWTGGHCVVMAPASFLQRPALWLQAIARYRGYFSGGPNFAYDLCVDKIGDRDLAGLDLSCWKAAFNGAEPVRAATLAAFSGRFAGAGFARGAFFPCYGLAEATLFVAGGAVDEDPRVVPVSAAALESGRVKPPAAGEATKMLVGCGRAAGEQQVVIVDPRSGRACPDGELGEIWIAGPSVAAGYRGQAAASAATFAARTVTGAGPFLRTGDLGYLQQGELFVAGRAKDLVIVRGRNHHPEDLEATAQACDQVLRGGRGACFGVDHGTGEVAVLVHEAPKGSDYAAIARKIRAAIFDEHDLQLARVALVSRGVVPRTSSGKVQRGACRRRLLAGELRLLFDDQGTRPADAVQDESSPALERVRALVARVLRCEARLLPASEPLIALGLDSLSAAQLHAELAARLLVVPPIEELLGTATIGSLARAPEIDRPAPPAPAPEAISPAQRRLWVLEQLEDGPGGYHIPFGIELHGPLDLHRLRSALTAVVARHEVLQSRFVEADGELQARVSAGVTVPLAFDDLAALPPDKQHQRVRALQAADGAEPFDLARPPLLRARLLRLAEERHRLVLVAHHIVADGWSMGILLDELAAAYGSRLDERGPAPQLAARPAPRHDEAALERYWRDQLAGLDCSVPLPYARPVPSGRAGALRVAGTVDAATRAALQEMARRERVTPFVVLTALFGRLLACSTGQEELAIATVVSDRESDDARRTVGPLINTVLLRVGLAPDVTLGETLGRLQRVVGGALAHAALPFDRVVQVAGLPARGRPPFRVMVVYHNYQVEAVRAGELRFEPVELDIPLVPFDLTLSARAAGDVMTLAIDADAGRFDQQSVQRVMAQYLRLLAVAVDAADRRLSELTPWASEELVPAAPRASLDVAGLSLVHEAVAAWAARQPHAPAIIPGDDQPELWTYARLEGAANALAAGLRARGLGPERLAGIHIDDPALRLVAALGVLKTGGGYVPLDTALPAAALDRLVDAARPVVVLSDRPGWSDPRAWLLAPGDLAPAPRPACVVRSENVALVTFTSGSTGEPRGVAITHGALAAHAAAVAHEFALDSTDRVLQFAAFGFDVSAEETFPTWSRGAAVVTIRDRRPAALQAVAARRQVTVLNLPSRYFELWFAETRAAPSSLRLLVVGTEPVTAGALAAFLSRHPGVSCRNAYGLTEATITSLVHRPDPTAEGTVPIGRPVQGTTAYVLDRDLAPVGRGGRGELYLGGTGLARGYLHQPGATAHRFVPSPFGPPGARLLRTGDVVHHRWDGELEFLGRTDRQAKVRGHRIEPDEIEAALRRAGAAEAAVAVEGERLVAHLELGARPLAELRKAVAERLPHYMVPSEWIEVSEWPRSPTGKIDRRALAVPHPRAAAVDDPAAGATEQTLAALYAEALGIETCGRTTDFFEAGGHSLLAMRLLERIERRLSVRLSVRDLFEAPTVIELSERVERMQRTCAEIDIPAAEPAHPQDGPPPLTAAQRRLWFLDQLDGHSARYNMPLAVELRGPIDDERLGAAFARLIDRHDVLRVTVARGQMQPGPRATLDIEPVVSWDEAEARAAALAREPFALDRGPLVRARLLRVSATERLLVFVLHHIVSDGRSLQVLLDELSRAYRGEPLPPLGRAYAVYARQEAARRHDQGLNFWRQALADSVPLWLPYDGSQSVGQAGRINVRLPVTTGELESLGRRAGATLHMVVLGAVQVLLQRYAGQEDVRLAVPVANRSDHEVQDTLGCFVNTVVIRSQVSAARPFLDHLQQLKATVASAYEHQDTPFDAVVAAVHPDRGAGTPLFEVMLLVERDGSGVDLGPGVQSVVRELDSGAAKFDLTVTVRFKNRQVWGELEFDQGRFRPQTVEGMLEAFGELLKSIVREPEALSGGLRILGRHAEDELAGLEAAGPVTAQRGAHEYFREQAARTPGAVAVESGARTLTYRELDEWSNRVARGLARRGIGSESRVGVRLRRTEELIVAMLGVAKAGAALVPIDPEYPDERQRLIERASGVATTLRSIDEFAREDGAPVSVAVDPRQVSHVIYTSGSEGVPKGVAITHGSVGALLEWARTAFSPQELARVLASTSVCFDLSVFEIYAPLSAGGTVVMVESVLDLGEVDDVTLVNTVPSAMAKVLDSLGAGVRVVNLAGEALPRSLVDAVYARGVAAVWNLYGPTEDTTYSTAARIPRDERTAPLIGRPLPGTRAYVLDDRLGRVANGARGELYLSGAGLARGYLQHPGRTAERFLPDPFGAPGERMYRTGDWVRRRPDGALDYLGRRDAQVKVRGYRIEPGEVEEALRRAGAREAVVVARGERLVAYVESGRPVVDLRAALAAELPRYLVPALLVEVPQWPRTPSGKIDRQRLPEPGEQDEQGTAPRTETERAVARLFEELLQVRAVKRETSFFEAGGHSLAAMQLIERIQRELGTTIGVRVVFEAPTVWELAQRVESAGARPAVAPARPADARREATGPLTSAQRRLWFLEHLAAAGSSFHVPLALDVRGPVDTQALAGAFRLIVERHEALRTTFGTADEVPFQRVAASVELPFTELAIERAGLEAYVLWESTRPFDLARGPLFRITLLRLGPEEAVLLVVMHHIVCDEWSVGVMLREFAEIYQAQLQGRSPGLPGVGPQLLEHARWEASDEAQATWDEHRRYWQAQLAELATLRLPGRRPAGGRARGAYRAFTLGADLGRAVRRVALEHRATPFMVLLAAFSTLLSRYTGGDDVAVGAPVANRRRDTEALIGFFVNQLVMRVRLRGAATFADLVGRVRETVLDAYAHQALPFDEIVAAARARASDPMLPLARIQLDVHNAPFGPLTIGPLTLSPRTVARTAVQFDLQLSVEEIGDELACFLGYDADRFDAGFAARFADDLGRVLAACTADPGQPLTELAVAPLAGASVEDGDGDGAGAEDFSFER